MKAHIHSTQSLSRSPLLHKAGSSPWCCGDPYRPYSFKQGGVKAVLDESTCTYFSSPLSAPVCSTNPAPMTSHVLASTPVQCSCPSNQLNKLDHVSAVFGQAMKGTASLCDHLVMPAPSNPVKKAHKPKKPKKMNKAPKPSPRDHAHLQKKSAEKKKQFRRSDNTNNSHSGQVKRGQEFVAHFSMEQAEAEELNEDDSCNVAPAMLYPDFDKVFDGTPIQCTPLAISMFMTYKCFTENQKVLTAVAIQAAFLCHYNHM